MLIRHVVSRYLEDCGYAVESATNGMEALEMVAKLPPGMIITDLQMPIMNGKQLIDVLKVKPETAAIPVVVLSAKSSSTEMNPENRADYVIFKDIDIAEQLQQVLESALHTSRASAQHQRGLSGELRSSEIA